VFYLMYHLYRQYFPLLALTTYSKVLAGTQEASSAARALPTV
jgi:hypothetical protein